MCDEAEEKLLQVKLKHGLVLVTLKNILFWNNISQIYSPNTLLLIPPPLLQHMKNDDEYVS